MYLVSFNYMIEFCVMEMEYYSSCILLLLLVIILENVSVRP